MPVLLIGQSRNASLCSMVFIWSNSMVLYNKDTTRSNGQFNATQDGRNDVPAFVGSGERSFFAKIVPKIAKGLRTHGFIQVESGLIPGGVHFLIEDQPEAVAELIERYGSRYSDSSR